MNWRWVWIKIIRQKCCRSLLKRGTFFPKEIKAQLLNCRPKVIKLRNESSVLWKSVKQSWLSLHHCGDVYQNRNWSFCCFVLAWLLGWMCDFSFQTWFRNADSPWTAALPAVRQRNKGASPLIQAIFLGASQPPSRKRVCYGPKTHPRRFQVVVFIKNIDK